MQLNGQRRTPYLAKLPYCINPAEPIFLLHYWALGLGYRYYLIIV